LQNRGVHPRHNLNFSKENLKRTTHEDRIS
jgi:hypothetical protein